MRIVHQAEELFYNDFGPLITEMECGEHYDATNAQHVRWMRHRVSALYMSGAQAICLYNDDGRPDGFILVLHYLGLEGVRCFGKKATIAMFGLNTERRGHGLGVCLLQEAESWLRARGCECLYVDTYADNQGAIRFYVRQGFIPVAYHPGENGRDDKGQVYLFKNLA